MQLAVKYFKVLKVLKKYQKAKKNVDKKLKKTRRAGIEPAYSDYEPNELPLTQPPRKIP